jgi:hypothetical protein
VPGVTVELERIVPRKGVIIPYFWVRGVDINDVEASFSTHPCSVNTLSNILRVPRSSESSVCGGIDCRPNLAELSARA